MRTRPLRAALACALLAQLAPAARADTLTGTKQALISERANTIELRLDRGHATLVVRRTFDNRSLLHDQAILDLTSLPEASVAVGLRTLGGTAKEPIWYAGELLDAELAAKRYRELTGIGGWYPKDPALLSWRDRSHLKLQVFPVPPKGEKTVEYTLLAPTRYEAGRYRLELPPMDAGVPATLTLKAARDGDAVFVDGVPGVPGGDARRLLGELSLSLAPASPPKLGGRFSAFTFAKGRALLHGAVEIAKPLSARPLGAHVIVLIDGSRSLDGDDRAAQLAAARAYLRALPDAKAQILIFDRVARPLEGVFVSSAQAIADLGAATITPRNGSELDVALAEAATRIAAAPAGAPRRILALTDLATRSTLVPERISGLAATSAIVHLATVRNDEPSLLRDDADPWAIVPRATGGVLWHATAYDATSAAADAVFEEWVRPLRVDRLSLVGVGLDAATFELPDSLAEGEGYDALRVQGYGTPAIEVKGELWSTPISAVLSSTPDEERRWAALAITSDLLSSLRDPEITTLALKGGAVSPMTSYLAIEPGVRPSTEGLDWRSGIALGDGIGFGSGSGRMGSVRSMTPPDPWVHLRRELAAIAKGCGGGEASVRLETTWSEIVAVDVTPKVDDAKYKACVREGAFTLELPEWFRLPWAKWEIDVSK